MSGLDALRGAIVRRDDVAARVQTLRARVASLETEARAAADMASDAAVTYKAALVNAVDGGPFVDANDARAARDASSSHADDVAEARAGLQERLTILERDHVHAKKLVARAKKNLCVARAAQYEAEFRASARLFARSLARYHRLGATASHSHFEEFGEVGIQPIPIDGKWGLLIKDSENDPGIIGIFKEENVTRALTTIKRETFSEAELLLEADDDDHATTTTTNGATLAQESTSQNV